jgi:hypothetical protein
MFWIALAAPRADALEAIRHQTRDKFARVQPQTTDTLPQKARKEDFVCWSPSGMSKSRGRIPGLPPICQGCEHAAIV